MRWPRWNSGGPPTPPPGPSQGAPPLSSPTCSGSASPAAAAVSDHPCVTLDEWWLARVEGHERKIAVAGIFSGRNKAVLDFAAEPVAKCHEPYVLESENGTVVLISGLFNIKRTLGNGFTIQACEKFSLGFPHWWEKWYVLYPNMIRSQTGSQPRSSGTRYSREDSAKFYLERFHEGKLLDSYGTVIHNALNNVKPFSSNGDAFPDSSRLSNGAPRFEEYTCDDDTPTIEKSDVSNIVSKKVENMETNLIGESTLKEGSHDGIESNVASVSMVECTNDEGNVEIDNASRINNGRQKTRVSSSKRRGCLKQPHRVAVSESVPAEDTPTLACSDVLSSAKRKQPVGSSRKQRSAFQKIQRASKSPNIGNLSPLTRGWPRSLTVSTPESLKLRKTRSGRVVVPKLDPGCQNIAYAHDGSISAIISIDSSSLLQGSRSKKYSRKKKKTN